MYPFPLRKSRSLKTVLRETPGLLAKIWAVPVLLQSITQINVSILAVCSSKLIILNSLFKDNEKKEIKREIKKRDFTKMFLMG